MTEVDELRHRPGPVLAVVSMGLALAALPSFMVGGLAVQIRDELGLTESALGGAVSIGFVVSAVAAALLGTVADRLGPRGAIGVGGVFSIVALASLGLGTSSWVTLVVFLCVAGVGMALIDPGLAVLVTRGMPLRRHGLAFGVKEASIPIATMLAGLAVPAIALTVGWRWAFALGLIPVGVLVMLLMRPDMAYPGTERTTRQERRISGPVRLSLLLIAAGGALGSAAASGVGVFLTESGVAMGLSSGAAGYLLAAGSVAGIATRIGTGIYADRSGEEQLGLISSMLILGALAMALASIGTTPLLVLGAIGAFSGGWGWTGLFFLSLVRAGPQTPGTFSGIGTAGLGLGNAAGPLSFGFLAQNTSFTTAWLVAAAAAATGAILIRLARRAIAKTS